MILLSWPSWFSGKESICQVLGSIPGLGRSPGEGNGNSCQYSCLENSMDRGAWWTIVHGVPWLSDSTHVHMCALTLSIPHSPLFAVFLCVQPIVDPLTFGTDWLDKATLCFLEWCSRFTPDHISIILRHIGLSKDGLPLLTMVKSWWSLASSFPRDS